MIKKNKNNIYKNININIDNNKNILIGNNNKISEQNIEKKDDDSIPERDFNNFYSTWWSGKNEHYQGAGVGLAIKKELAKRVYRTEFIDGRAILADLQLKQNVKIRIIVLYMPADPKQINERTSITNQIESWIKNGIKDNKSIIVMGDLNADPDKLDKIINSNSNKKLEDKYKIIQSLRSLGMFDSQIGINQEYNQTWKGPLIDNKLE